MGQRYINEFTFGFELEAWGETLNDKDQFLKYAYDYFKKNSKLGHQMDLSTMSHGGDGSIKPDSNNNICNSCGGSGRIVCQNCGGSGSVPTRCRRCNNDPNCIFCGGSGQVTSTCGECDGDGDWHCDDCDGSGEHNGGRRDNRAFEFKSPIMNINNGNISKTIRFLCEGMTKFNIKTNDSCGFHIHMGFPEKSLTHIDRLWVLLNLINDAEMLKKISTFHNIHLFDGEYANFDLITNLTRIINNNDGTSLNNKLVKSGIVSDKYVVLRQHPQGTLEWRGPRGFMNDGDPDEIKDFFIKCFFPFAKWIKDVLSKKEVVVLGKLLNKDLLIRESIKYNEVYKNRVVPEYFIKAKKEDFRFSDSFDKSKINSIFSNHSWIMKQNRLQEINNINFSDDEVLISGGVVENKKLTAYKTPLSFHQVKVYGNFNVKNANTSHFYNGSFACEKAKNNNFNDATSVKINDSEYDSFMRSKIADGKYSKGNFKKSQIFGGDFVNCDFSSGRIDGGVFNSSNFSDQVRFINGVLKHCEVKLYTTSFEKTKTLFINCSYFVRRDVIFKNVCVQPLVFLQNINVYLKKMFEQKKIINAKFKNTKGYTNDELISYLNSMINEYL